MESTYTVAFSLAERVLAKLAELRLSKQELAIHVGLSRTAVSQYLSGKYRSDPANVESALEGFLTEQGEAAITLQVTKTEDTLTKQKAVPKKQEYFESRDFIGVIGVCNACQENQGLGIITGKSGYGKTHSLKHYAKLPRVVHIECNETMNCKDIVRKIERAIGLPKSFGSIDERLEHVVNFFNSNRGYLLIVDEADKLISKYTQKKIEILRYIADGSTVGIVIAGEPALESAIKSYDNRFANRMDFYYKLQGLNKTEISQYFKGYEVDEAAMEEFYIRACNTQTGCFRLLDRTLNNVMRILKNSDKNCITLKVIQEASNMMML